MYYIKFVLEIDITVYVTETYYTLRVGGAVVLNRRNSFSSYINYTLVIVYIVYTGGAQA